MSNGCIKPLTIGPQQKSTLLTNALYTRLFRYQGGGLILKMREGTEGEKREVWTQIQAILTTWARNCVQKWKDSSSKIFSGTLTSSAMISPSTGLISALKDM